MRGPPVNVLYLWYSLTVHTQRGDGAHTAHTYTFDLPIIVSTFPAWWCCLPLSHHSRGAFVLRPVEPERRGSAVVIDPTRARAVLVLLPGTCREDDEHGVVAKILMVHHPPPAPASRTRTLGTLGPLGRI